MRGPVLPQRPSRARTRPDQRGSTAAAGAAGAGFAAALWYWATEACSKPLELWCGEGDLKRKVLPLCSCLLQPFRPSPWALNNHVQNIFGFLRTATIRNEYRRQLVIAHDGGTLALDWWSGCDSHAYGTATTPVLLVLHGINGGSQEGYCKWMCEAAWRRGWRAVGGVFLTKYLSEADRGLHASLAAASSAFKPFEGSGLVATAVVSTPVCLFNSSQNLSKPWTAGYLYNMALAYKLREFMVEHRAAITAHTSLNVDKAMQHWEMGAIEDEGIPHTFGFSNRQEYYEASNSLQYIPFIRTPTLFLVSKDDPFLGVLPDEECSANPHTLLAATRPWRPRGLPGGCSPASTPPWLYSQGLWPLGPAFMDRAVLQFLEVAWSQLPAVAQAAMQLPPELLPPEAQAVGLGVGHGAGASHEEAAGEGGEAHGMSESGRAAAWLHTENPYVVSQFKLPPLPRWEGAYQQQQELQQQQQQQACEQQQQQQLGPDQQVEGTDRGEPHVPLTGLGVYEAEQPPPTSVPADVWPEQQAAGAAEDSSRFVETMVEMAALVAVRVVVAALVVVLVAVQLGESSPAYGALPSPAQEEVLGASLAAGSRSADEVSQAAIPDLSCRYLFLQLCHGMPEDGAHTRPSAPVAAVPATHPDLRARLEAIPRYPRRRK
ncbi:hypothetical protein QJQ45_009561 [Haematococcus lacustris]|nr:hypothetical protein QJQ45_009561 [Haematococcus lacustris]